MTKKRFVGLFQGDMLVSVKDTQTNERVNIIQIITLANILYEENEHLKQDLSEYCNFSLHDVLDKKNKEIEQLKSEIQKLKNVSTK